MKLTFSNPRRSATIDNWPLGSSKRGVATFTVHSNGKKGERVSRTTTGKPKYTTYGAKMCIVDADNGRTYLLQYDNKGWECIHIISSDLQHDAGSNETGLDSAYVSKGGKDDAVFNQLKELVEAAR